MAKKITALLIDDHTLVRRAFRRLLEDESDVEVVGEAGDGEAGVRLARELRPRVVVMDYRLPGIDGFGATKQILATDPGVSVLILTMDADRNLATRAREAGARGFLRKSADEMGLVTAIRKIAGGEAFFPMLKEQAETAAVTGRAISLSAREREILQLIVDGNSTKAIAALLGLSVNTVAAHRANIRNTLRLPRSADLVVYALRLGLVQIR